MNDGTSSKKGPGKLIAFAAFVAGVVVLWVMVGDRLSPERLSEHEVRFKEFQQLHPVLVYGVAFVGYVTVTALSLPVALLMTLIYGWLLGFWSALVLVSFASTAGATLAFLLSRYLLRDTFQERFGDRLARFNRALEDEGAFYLFTLRLIPAVPFFVINAVMGLTPMRVATYWWVSQLGMLPGTAAYIYAGSALPSLSQLVEQGLDSFKRWDLAIAFAVLGVLPLAIKRIVGAVKARQKE